MSITMNAASSYSSGQGIDVTSTVDQIIEAESAPMTAMRSRQSTISNQVAMLQSVNNQLSALAATVTSLRDVTGPLMAQSAVSSDSTRVAVSSDTSAVSGSHLIEVSCLASNGSVYADSVSSGTTLSGTMQFKVGGVAKSVTIDSGSNTVAKLASTLNAGDYGVSASVLHDTGGDKLVISSKTDGKAGEITEIASPPELSFHAGSAARDAQFTIDGVPFSSATNTASGMLQGVTLTLTSQTTTPVKITVEPDESRATQAIQSFVSTYNAVIKTINEQFTYDASNHTVGTLSADSSMRVLQSLMLKQATIEVTGNGSLTTLRSLGLEMQNDGTLTVNSGVLGSAINDHTTDFRNFFLQASTGFASKMGDTMLKLNNSADGLLYVDINGLNDTSRSIGDQIDAFQARLDSRRSSLIAQYSHLDAELRSMPILLNQISSQLGTNKTTS